MSREDDSLSNYADVMTRVLASTKADLTPTKTTECIDCDEPIPPLRKAAAPWATRCVDCEEDHTR